MRRIYLLLALVSFFLSACEEMKIPIEADDFGYPKIIVKAKGKNVTGIEDNQLSEWESTNYKYNGEPLAIMVYNDDGNYTSLWTSWFGGEETDDAVASSMRSTSKCEIRTPVIGDSSVTFTNPNQPPCIFHKGQGLYLLLTNPAVAITDPNLYPNINRNPSTPTANFFTLGLWQNIAMYSQGSLAAGYVGDFNNSVDYIGGAAYFKILDKYYDDNSGAFYVALKRGFDPKETPPITYVIQMITSKLDQSAKDIYLKITENNQYLSALKAGLTLYMILQGLLYITGMMNMTQRELLFTFIRLIIVMQLLTSQSSWTLFHDYFFSFFTTGLDSILSIITSTMTGQTTSGFTFFDKMIGLFYSYETWMKILALSVSVPSGIVVAGLLGLALAILTLAIVQGVILYLLAYLAISILIILAPIFITFMLFQITKPLFEGWINQFAGYFFQAVLVFASIVLLSQVIIDKIYKILGFRVCYQDYITFTVNGSKFVLLKAWQICSFSMNEAKGIITIPGYGFWDPSDADRFCTPYECTGERYINLPFLDLVKDASLIKAFENPFIDLNLPMLYNGFILVLLAYLMFKFNAVVPDIGKGIAGGSGSGSALGKASQSSLSDIKSFAGGVNKIIENSKSLKLIKKAYRASLSSKKRAKLEAKDARKKERKDKLDKYGKKIDKGMEAIKESKAFKILGSVLPPLSITMESRETEQARAKAEKKRRDKAAGPKSGFAKAKSALVGAASDTIIGGVNRAGSAIKRKTANVARRAVGLEAQSKPVVTDDNRLGVSDVIKATGRHMFGQVGESAKLAQHQLSNIAHAPSNISNAISRKKSNLGTRITNIGTSTANIFRSKDNKKELGRMIDKPEGYRNETDMNKELSSAGEDNAIRRQIKADQADNTNNQNMRDEANNRRSAQMAERNARINEREAIARQKQLNQDNKEIAKKLRHHISAEDQALFNDPVEVERIINTLPENEVEKATEKVKDRLSRKISKKIKKTMREAPDSIPGMLDIDRALDTRSGVEQENLARENLAIVRALNYPDPTKITDEDQKKLDNPNKVQEMIDKMNEDDPTKLQRMRDIMGNIRRGE